MKRINWKYALGEIVIVIIGITIAFWLNSWKENSKSNALRIQYIENIRTDINREIDHLEEIDSLVKTKLQIINEVKPFLGKGKENNRGNIAKKVFELARLINFQPENITYSTLVN